LPKKNDQIVPINYTSRDFLTIKNDLLNYVRTYYPDTLKDFNEASFGSLMLDTVAYVGDILSFYLDYSVNESFMATAVEYGNVAKHARQMGYKEPGPQSSTGFVTCYIVAPASTYGLGPDSDYLPVLRRGTLFSSTGGASFTLAEDIDFGNSDNEAVVASVNENTNLPTEYAVKASGQVISGELDEATVSVGGYEKFLKVELPADNVTEIVSVTDSQGHVYYEVDYLSQNTIFISLPNSNEDKDSSPSLMKAITVPRRFTLVRENGRVFLQFGYGSESEIRKNSIIHPSDVILKQHGRQHETDTFFDPSRIIDTDKFGVVPVETELTITYRTNSPGSTNAAVGTISTVGDAIFRFSSKATSTASKTRVKSSLEVSNDDPILGEVDVIDSNELKMRSMDFFATQNRAVTKQDYISLVYRMPSKFGAIRRCNIVHDNDSFKRNLNLYVISEDTEGSLIETNGTIKNNLKVWLNQHKMINDTIDILDGMILNFQVEYVAISDVGTNKFDVLNRANLALREYFDTQFDFGEPLYKSTIFNILNNVMGIVDVSKVKILPKFGTGYSSLEFNTIFDSPADGRYVKIPENFIFELKNPSQDIKGTIL
tara:strand:- start:162 stop:1961 length:1800 start_codon:yes stop_codon:yes gene_type:complete